MKINKKAIIFILIIVLFAFVGAYFILNKKPSLDIKKLSGSILMQIPPNDSTWNMGTGLYSIKEKKFTQLTSENITFTFNKDKKSLLGSNRLTKLIIEFDLISKNFKVLKSDTNEIISFVKYIPKSNSISYVSGKNLTIYDYNSDKETILNDIGDDFVWDKNGENILFSSFDGKDEWIYNYNIYSKTKSKLYKGYKPKFSENYKCFAFLRKGLFGNEFVVEEIEQKKRIVYPIGVLQDYELSPNGEYIAYVLKKDYYDSELKVVDYRNKMECTLIKDIRFMFFDFQWISYELQS